MRRCRRRRHRGRRHRAAWSWRLLYDPSAEVPETQLPAAIPGLVTFGRRHDAQVLVDLEAFGTVSIDGDQRAAEDLLRSIVLEARRRRGVGGRVGVDGRVRSRWRRAAESGADPDGRCCVGARSWDRGRRATTDGRRRRAGHVQVADRWAAHDRELTVIVVRTDGCEILDELRALATARSGWRSWASVHSRTPGCGSWSMPTARWARAARRGAGGCRGEP